MGKELKLYQDFSFKQVTGTEPQATSEDPSILYIEGYASVFLNSDGTQLSDRDGESVNVSMLDIDNFRKNPILVYNHDWSDVIGKVVEVQKDAKGLYVKVEVHKLTGREQIFEAVQKGLLKTFSIGFIPRTFNYIEATDILEIASAELIELSIVGVPANADSLFTVAGQKALTISKKLLKEQNHMTCDEVNGICTLSKTQKGKGMKKNIEGEEENPTSTEQPQAEVKPQVEEAAKEEPKAEVKPQVEEKPKEDPKPSAEPEDKDSLSVEDLAAQIVAAQQLAEEKAREAEEKAKLELEEKEKQRIAEEEQRVKDALSYIKEQKEVIEGTAAADLDTEELDELYELLTTTAEAIEAKVIEAVQAAQSA